MEKVKIANEIFQFNDFISIKEAKFLISIAETATQSDWDVYNFSERDQYSEWDNRILHLKDIPWAWSKCGYVMEAIFERCKNTIDNHLNENKYTYTDMAGIYRSRTGQSMNPHHDSGADPRMKYGVVIYLNDDYEGGEVYYPKLDIEIKPKALSLIIHPANQIYRHGVKEVKSGIRYSTTTFLKI